MKKIILYVAVVLMSENVWAEIVTGSPEYGNGCGENCSWSYDTETGALTISGTGEMANYDVTEIEGKQNYGLYTKGKTIYSTAPWGTYNVTNIIIENGITSVGKRAFESSNIESIKFPASVTSLGVYSFLYSTIQEVDIPETMTVAGGAFESCSKLTSVTLPDNLTYISSWMFGNDGALKEVIIPESVKSIGEGAFANSGLENLVLPQDMDISKISGAMFTGSSGVHRARELKTLYCTMEQKQKCEDALKANESGFAPTIYAKQGNDYLVYDDKGNVVGKYASASDLNKGVATEKYKYDSAGHLVGIFDGNGQRIWGKKIYTVEEAMEATEKGEKFHVFLTYK